MFKEYCVWRRGHSETQWSLTSHIVKARTDNEAQSKVKRMFSGCGFSYMSLFVVERGIDANSQSK